MKSSLRKRDERTGLRSDSNPELLQRLSMIQCLLHQLGFVDAPILSCCMLSLFNTLAKQSAHTLNSSGSPGLCHTVVWIRSSELRG